VATAFLLTAAAEKLLCDFARGSWNLFERINMCTFVLVVFGEELLVKNAM